jgi:ketosteroid isomerase-like protein
MVTTKTIIEKAYSAFNKRDIDGALAFMTQDVSWPKASEGGNVVGKEEIRAYPPRYTNNPLVQNIGQATVHCRDEFDR